MWFLIAAPDITSSNLTEVDPGISRIDVNGAHAGSWGQRNTTSLGLVGLAYQYAGARLQLEGCWPFHSLCSQSAPESLAKWYIHPEAEVMLQPREKE